MKCCYKFPVKWAVDIEKVRPFEHDGWRYDFLQENNRITQIEITVPLATSDKLPALCRNPHDSRTIDVQVNEPAVAGLLMKTLRTLEGFLSVYCLEKISLDEINMSWIPESEEEKERLKTKGIALRFKRPEGIPFKVPFGIIARSIVASRESLDWEIPLGFFRKGRNDFLERRYIDAVYDYYFLLETLFANGKTKNYQVKQEFTKSPELLSFSEKVLKGGVSSIMSRGGRQPLLDAFRKKHLGQTPAQFLEHIVNLRGSLHHHSIQNKQIWNPLVEYEYELDALLLGDLCFEICSKKVESMICVPLNVNQK